MDVNEKIIANMQEFGLSTDIKPVTMKHLAKIDKVLETMIKAQTDAVHEIKDNKISINRIAKEAGISRQTFYNNPVITAYIEQYLATNAISNPYDTIEALRNEIRLKDKQITGLVQRDATVSKYKAQNQELTDEIASLQATIKSQENLIRDLKSEKMLRMFN